MVFLVLTFKLAAAGRLARPWRITVSGKVSQFQIANGQSYNGGLVQLAGYGCRQGQHFGQLVELIVLFAAPRACRIPRLLLAQLQNAATNGTEISQATTINKY